MNKQVFYLYDQAGNPVAAQVPIELWRKLEPLLADEESRDLSGFERFLASWDYKYDYDPAVSCPNCHACTRDWREDMSFSLHSASLGGMLVFKCRRCGASVRHKYFRHKMEVEYTPPAGLTQLTR